MRGPPSLTADEALFVYGIVPAGTALPDTVVGLGDRAPLVIEVGAVAALVDTIDLDRPLGTREDLLGYRRVLDAVSSLAPVVPVAFGSVLDDGAAVTEDLLGQNHDHFVELLEFFRGRHQYVLRGRYHQEVVLAEIVAEDPEIAALREQTRDLPEEVSYGDRVRLGELVAAAVQEKRYADGQAVVAGIAPYAVEHRVREVSGLEDMVEVALLVDTERGPELEGAAEDLAEAMHERVRLQLLGPMPPYDFVQED